MKNIETKKIINATPEKVWKVLIDNTKYSSWNPFITKSTGAIVVDGIIENTISLNGKDNHFKPVIKEMTPEKKFSWFGKAPLGIFNGEHYFILNAMPNGKTELVHGENFTGWLSGIILKSIGEDTRRGFEAMNVALKNRVEQL